MKILLISIGTRGDIEPFISIGEILKAKGHNVIFAVPEQFNNLIPKEFTFFPLCPKFIELIESKEGKILMGGSSNFFTKVKVILKLYKTAKTINHTLIKEQYSIIKFIEPDLIIHHGKAVYPLLWSLKHGKKTVLLSPIPNLIHYTKGSPHTGFNISFGEFFNKLTYKIANYGLVKTIKSAQKLVSDKTYCLHREILSALLNEKLVYTISPQLFQRQEHWTKNVQVLGYHERNKKTNWQPDEKLTNFLYKNEKILFVSFGSMLNTETEKRSKIIYSVLSELKIPTIVNTASGGLVELEEYRNNQLFYFAEQIPYDWILEKVYAIIHHGGSGTTHSGLKYACPTLIIPHIFDQFSWNNLVYNIGAGPKGISIYKISKEKLKPLISDLMNNENYKIKTKEISEKMKNENMVEELCKFILG